MSTTSFPAIVQQIHGMLERREVNELDDAHLLERFLESADEAAFAALMRRHAPMVMAACRRILRDSHDAEDALQATFLVLARKGHSILRRERIALWLYGVAVRTAMALRGRKARGRLAESEMFHMRDTETKAEERMPDWQIQFDQEMQGLPAKYRTVLVLCELQGLSRRDAAKQLRLSEGTVSSRLARGRQMLRKRLERHGFTGLQMAGAPVAASLIAATAQAARVATESGSLAECVSASVASLVEGVMKTMLVSKMAIKAVVVLALGGLLAGAANWSAGPAGFAQHPPLAYPPVVPPAYPQPAPAKDQGAPSIVDPELQGIWRTKSDNKHGQNRTYLCVRHGTVDFLWTDSRLDERGKMKIQTDTTKLPRQFRFVPLTKSGEASQGIYEITGNELRILGVEMTKPLPSNFVGEDGKPKDDGVLHFQKLSARELEAFEERERFLGTWKLVSLHQNNKDLTKKAGDYQIIFKFNGLLALERSAPVARDGNWRIKVQSKLKEIDLDLPFLPQMAGWTTDVGNSLGIYKMDKDKLTICFRGGSSVMPNPTSTPPKPPTRPTEFESKDEAALAIFERVPPSPKALALDLSSARQIKLSTNWRQGNSLNNADIKSLGSPNLVTLDGREAICQFAELTPEGLLERSVSILPTILVDGEILLHVVLSQKEEIKKSSMTSADLSVNITQKHYTRIVKENQLVKLPFSTKSPEESTWVEFTAKIEK